MDNSSRSLSVYCRKRCSCSKIEKSRTLKCNGSTFGPMKLHGRWRIKCGLCIHPCLSIEAKKFWHVALLSCFGICLGICFGICLVILVYVHMYMDVNTAMSYL